MREITIAGLVGGLWKIEIPVAEMAQWEPERIEQFFRGLATMLAATTQGEQEPTAEREATAVSLLRALWDAERWQQRDRFSDSAFEASRQAADAIRDFCRQEFGDES